MKGGTSVMRAANKELLLMREEAVEADKQKCNRKHADRRRRRRKGRRRGKKNETSETLAGGRRVREEVELPHYAESRLKNRRQRGCGRRRWSEMGKSNGCSMKQQKRKKGTKGGC